MMDAGASPPHETHVLLKQVQSHASLLSSKLAKLAQHYDSDSSSSSFILRQENHVLRQQLEQLRRTSAELPCPRDTLGSTAPPRLLQDVAYHGAPAPGKKSPKDSGAKDQDKGPWRTLKVHAHDCNRIRRMDTAPSPKELWNAVAFDSGEDFKSRMPRRLRQSQMDRLSAQQVDSRDEPSPWSPEKSPSLASGKSDRSLRRKRKENEAEAEAEAEAAANDSRSSLQGKAGAASATPALEAAESTACVDANKADVAAAVFNAGLVARSSAAQLSEDYPAPATPTRRPSIASGTSPILSDPEADQAVAAAAAAAQEPTLSRRSSFLALLGIKTVRTEARVSVTREAPLVPLAAPHDPPEDAEEGGELHAEAAARYIQQMAESRDCPSLGSDHGPRSALALLLQPASTSIVSPPQMPVSTPVAVAAVSKPETARRSLSGRRGSRTPRSSQRGGSPSNFFSFSRLTPRAPAMEKGPEPVKALLSKQGNAAEEVVSSPRSTQLAVQQQFAPAEREQESPFSQQESLQRQASPASQDSSQHRMLISQDANADSGVRASDGSEIASVKALASVRSRDTNVRIDPKMQVINDVDASVQMQRQSQASAEEVPDSLALPEGRPPAARPSESRRALLRSQATRYESAFGAGTGLWGEERRDTARAGLSIQPARTTDAMILTEAERDPLERWPIWIWELREKYLEQQMQLRNRGTISRSFMAIAAAKRRQTRATRFSRSTESPHESRCLSRCFQRMACVMVHPRHPKMSLWHLLGSTLILYDVFMIPIDAFRLPDYLWSVVITWCITGYWSADFILQFFLGFENELGQVEVSPRSVAVHYLRTWFWYDVIIVSFDWLTLLVFDVSGSSRGTRVSRVLRAFRFIRVVRIVKLINLVGRALDRVNSELILMIAKVMLLILAVFCVAHYIGCYWYFIGDQNFSKTPSTWLTATDHEGILAAGFMAEDFDFWSLYAISLHWSFAQSGLTHIEIQATTTLEHIYVIVVGFSWLVLMAFTFSILTVWLIQFREANRSNLMQETMIRKYLKDNCVSTDLCEEVVRYCRKFSQSRARRVHTPDIVIFEDLPLELRVNVHRQVFMPILTAHPLFEEFLKVNEAAVTATCHLAMTEHYYRAGSEVFTHGDEATFMFFVLSGELEYFTVKNDFEPTTVGVAEWICEAVLWRRWTCRGRLIAKCSSELIGVDAFKFHGIIDEGEDKGWTVDLLRNYAATVTAHFDHVDPNTDIWSQGDYLPDIVHRAWMKTYGRAEDKMAASTSVGIPMMKKHLKQRLGMAEKHGSRGFN